MSKSLRIFPTCKIGTPFYLMDFVDGRIFRDPTMAEITDKDERRKAYMSIIETVIKLHSLDFKQIGLNNFAKIGDYFPRQLRNLMRVYRKQSEDAGYITGLDAIADE